MRYLRRIRKRKRVGGVIGGGGGGGGRDVREGIVGEGGKYVEGGTGGEEEM